MILLLAYKTLLILAAGCFVTITAMLFMKKMAPSVKLMFHKTRETSQHLSKVTDKGYLKEILSSMVKEPDTKRSQKIKIIISVFVLFGSFVLIGKIIFAVLCGLGAYYGITQYAGKQQKKKEAAFDNQLIEALGMITNSVRAGQSLIQAMENMVKDTKPPLSVEFEEVLKQVQLGTPVQQALLDMTKRIRSKDLRIAVTSINLARETGGNLGEILSRLVDTMRERKKIQGKITALTAQGKASGMVMSMVPFLLLAILYFMEPAMVGQLFTTLVGNILLAIVIVMIGFGMFFINKIVQIDI